MKTVGLRRRPRHSTTQSATGQNDTPVTVVFRAHTDTVSKAPFLYSPKNYNRPMPTEEEGFTEAIIELCVPSDMNMMSTAAAGATAAGAGGVESSGNNNNNNTGSSSSGMKGTVPGGRYRYPATGGCAVSPGSAVLSPTSMDMGHRVTALPASEGTGGLGAGRPANSTGDTVPNSDVLRQQQQQQQEQQQEQTGPCTLSADASSFKYDSWVCRAYCFGEKDAIHANGAISVHQSLANKSQFINDIAKGKALARVVPTYDEVRRRFGLSHVELSFEDQSVSRADMFLISEALRDRILYEGEEVTLCGFRMKVNEMLRTLQPVAAESAAGGALQPGDGVKLNSTTALDTDGEHRAVDASWTSVKTSGSQRTAMHPHPSYPPLALPPQQHQQDEKDESRYRRVQSGLVIKETLVNFRSLSAVHYIIIEISKEMWNPTVDGRVTLSWVMRNFLREYLMHQVQKHKASLLIHVLMVGRLHSQYAIKGNVDVLHMMKIPYDYPSTSLVEEVELQCEVFLRRVLQEVKNTLKKEAAPVVSATAGETTCAPGEGTSTTVSQADLADTLTEQSLFVHAKNTCTVETINLVLEQCIQGRWDTNTGYIISVISAGKGLYQVTNDLSQAACTRLFNIGIEKINIICMGRPPLHITPLFEYFSGDETLRSQYHLHVDESNRRFYERPEWARCFFYHPAVDVTSCGLVAFELLTREEWMQRRRAVPGGKSHFIPGLGLTMAPLGDVLLPVMEVRRKGQVFSNSVRAADADALVSPMLSSAPSAAPEGGGVQKYSAVFGRFSDVRAMASSPPRVAGTRNRRENTVRGERIGIPRRPDATLPDGDSKTCAAPKHRRSCVLASWYCHHGCAVSHQESFSREYLYDFIITHSHDNSMDGRTRNAGVDQEANGIVSCGVSILDSDLQSGYMFLRLRIDSSALPEVRWSPEILTDMDVWALLMGAFSGEDNRLSEEEQTHFVSRFRAMDIFCRAFSAILEDGLTLILASRSSKVTFSTSEEIVFTFRQALFVAPGDVTPFSATIAHVQLRNSILFAIKPISPYRPTTENEVASSASRNLTTDVLLRRRWQFAHPELFSPGAQKSPWAALCHCKILPIYGTKSPYQRDSFFGVPTHQYAVSIEDSAQLLEYVLQRLHQQYQIVVVGSSPAGIQWPREDPTRNARLDLSIGHQIHELKIGEAGQSISVTRMLHSGMYSNTSVTHMMSHSYLLLNYLKPGFHLRTVHLETQIGEKLAFRWESLDSYLRDRHRPGVFIPRDPDWSLREGKLCVALLPEAFDAPPVSYAEFFSFISHRLCAQFAMKGAAELAEDRSGLTVNVPDTLDSPDGFPTRIVTFIHDNPLTLDPHCLLDHKTGRTLCLESPMRNRMLSTEVSLPAMYSPKCHCLLEISWLVCITPIIADWIRSIFAGAARYRMRAVPLSCPCPTAKSGFFVVRYTVRARTKEEESRFRRRLLSLLTNSTYRYFPDGTVMNRNCRLLHFSGLCYVTSQSEGTVVARWYENSMLRTGQPEHQQLLREFTQAVQLVRDEIESS